MNAFLQSLKDRGLEVAVAITDGSPLYKDALQSYWCGVEHQLCIFHVIKEVNKLILDGVRALM
jgi:transposase-like protein